MMYFFFFNLPIFPKCTSLDCLVYGVRPGPDCASLLALAQSAAWVKIQQWFSDQQLNSPHHVGTLKFGDYYLFLLFFLES
jgi:hypothetical protein